MDDVQVTKMEFPDENGGISLTAKHPAFAALALDCAKMFKEAGGINYCEWTMTAPDIGMFTLIIQRKGAMTPAERATKYRGSLEYMRDNWFTHLRNGDSCENLRFIESALRV